MLEKNIKTWKRAKLLTSGFKDCAERVAEELLEPRDKHSFIAQYIISFSVYIKAQGTAVLTNRNAPPCPRDHGKLDWSCLRAVCSQRSDPGEPGAPGHSAPLGSTGVRILSLLRAVPWGFIWYWGLCSQLSTCRVPDELRDVCFFWHCGFFFFSTRSCAVPQAEISPVLSLNALAEFWRRRLAERRETSSLQDLRVSAWWGIQPSWWNSLHFLSLIAVCSWYCWSGKDCL